MVSTEKDIIARCRQGDTQAFRYVVQQYQQMLLTLGLIIGLAHFSGATLRRPNVSIWLSLVLALIYDATRTAESEVRENEA